MSKFIKLSVLCFTISATASSMAQETPTFPKHLGSLSPLAKSFNSTLPYNMSQSTDNTIVNSGFISASFPHFVGGFLITCSTKIGGGPGRGRAPSDDVFVFKGCDIEKLEQKPADIEAISLEAFLLGAK